MGRTGVVLVMVAVAAPASADNRTGAIGVAARESTRPTGGTMTTGRTRDAAPQSDSHLGIVMSERWQDVPQRQRLRLSVQITDELTELGNLIGTSMNELSDDIVGLKFDGRKRRAKLRLGTGEGQYLRFRLESDWHFTQGKARIAAKLQLGIGEHHWNIELPDMEMAPANYRGDRGVEIRIPLFERTW